MTFWLSSQSWKRWEEGETHETYKCTLMYVFKFIGRMRCLLFISRAICALKSKQITYTCTLKIIEISDCDSMITFPNISRDPPIHKSRGQTTHERGWGCGDSDTKYVRKIQIHTHHVSEDAERPLECQTPIEWVFWTGHECGCFCLPISHAIHSKKLHMLNRNVQSFTQ